MQDKLTPRIIILGLGGMVLITSSSAFMALKIGTMPWPILFATILSLSLLGKRRGSSLKEVALTETIMSSGAMVAAGVVFTIPGIWMVFPEATVNPLDVFFTMLSGAALGIAYSYILRHKMIEVDNLPFPHGRASYETMNVGIGKGRDSKVLVGSMAGSTLFASLRDALGVIPGRLKLFSGSAIVHPVSLWLSPMALSLGAMITPISALMWIIGTLAAFFVFTPLSMYFGLFPSLSISDDFRKNIGIGIVIGTGISVLFKALFSVAIKRIRNEKKEEKREGKTSLLPIVSVSIASFLILSFLTPLTITQSIIVVSLSGLAVMLSAMLTGECGMNPLEVFGILVMLLCTLIARGNKISLFFVATAISTACGLTGVLMNDYRSGGSLGLDPKIQTKAEIIGAFGAVALSTIMIFVIKRSVGSFGSESYPAPQAAALASLIGGSGSNSALIWGAAIGFALYLLGLPSATFGLGFYLPIHISLSMGVGALLSFVLKRMKKLEAKDVNLLASGFMAGEGVVGVLVAISTIFM